MMGQRAKALEARPQIGPWGCYFLVYAVIGWAYGKPTAIMDPKKIIDAYDALNETKMMRRGPTQHTDGCYIANANGVLRQFGINASMVRKMPANHMLMPGEVGVEYWTMPRSEKGPGSIWGHFLWGNYDPWPRSKTRAEGHLDSLRVFKVLDVD